MKVIEQAGGYTVKTYSVHVQESDAFILVQQIFDENDRKTNQAIITLSRSDIKALAETEANTK